MWERFWCICFVGTFCHAVNPGPEVIATKGEVWPKPQQEEKSQNYFILQPETFYFKAPDNIRCANFLNNALERYLEIIKASKGGGKNVWSQDGNFLGYLESLEIQLGDCLNNDIVPNFGDDESYMITLTSKEFLLSASSIWGVLRGLETFSQLIYFHGGSLLLNSTTITDYPRFFHRGVMIDSARHYQSVDAILKTLDAMAFNKLNVLHWHITDDQSFPYQSDTYPELSNLGAYDSNVRVYSKTDVSTIVEYARLRGIRVIPEFDSPGHTRSWGVSHPELLTKCFEGNNPSGDLGPMDPTKSTTYTFLQKLLQEIFEVFPDQYFHIGGDEVDSTCWESNPDITEFMSKNNFTDYSQLQSYFMEKVVKILDTEARNYIVWEDAFFDGVVLTNATIVQVWRKEDENNLNLVTKAGKMALLSSCWYFADMWRGYDWTQFYECEPYNLVDTDQQKELILGGEACMWSEYVNQYSLIHEMWPGASATAEKLWSAENADDVEGARSRLEEHVCRMNRRGVAAQTPNGPGFCL